MILDELPGAVILAAFLDADRLTLTIETDRGTFTITDRFSSRLQDSWLEVVDGSP